jgi:endo-1,4-beta-D-glucanase Y
MKRLLVSLALAPVLFAACQKAEEPFCTNNDEDCDGVPDDLGRAVNRDDSPGPDPWDYDSDGSADGYAVDTDCDGDPDVLGLDSNEDGYVDSVDINPSGAADIITTGTSRATFTCEDGLGGDSVVPPGAGGTQGDGDTPIVPGGWHAPVNATAVANLPTEYARWKNFYLMDCGGGKLSVKNGLGGAYSEGIGYGMLITANVGTQAEFDGVWATYKAAPKSQLGLMQWTCNECVTDCAASNGSAASDGDLDAAMALLQAEARWGGGAYLEAGRQLVATIRGAVLRNCAGKVQLTPGEWDPGCGALNPSYFSPGYYRAFAQVDPLGVGVWNQAIDSAYELFVSTMNTESPADSSPTATIWPDGMGSTCYSCNGYDACRVPWRLAIDYAWSAEPRAQTILTQVSSMVDASGMPALSDGPNSAFYGALALSGMAVSQAKADQHYVTWTTASPLYDNAYYQSTLRMIYMLLSAGQFPSTIVQ